MKPIEFINDWVERNKDIIPFESVMYEYHLFSETHFLKITPENILTDERYSLPLSNFIFGFDKEFPSEGLCLISNDSLTKLEQPIELIPQVLPDIAPIYCESKVDYNFIPDILLGTSNKMNFYDFKPWSSLSSLDLTLPTISSNIWNNDLYFPHINPATWSIQLDSLLNNPPNFSGGIPETQISDITEENYSVEDEFQNQAA